MTMKNKFLIFLSVLILSCATFFAGCGTNQNVSVDSISISKKNLYLAEGQTAEISAQVFPYNATNQNYSLSSSDSLVVTVQDGFVVANKAGEATITATSQDGGFCDVCNVLVTTVKDNLALNNYNNMNMPQNANTKVQSQKKRTQNQNANQPKATATKTANSVLMSSAQRASAEIEDAKTASKNVLEQMKQELTTSLVELDTQKQNLVNFSKATLADDKTSFENVFQSIQIEMIDSLKSIKQRMLDSVDEAEQKIDDGEYSVDTKDIGGVTFVVISDSPANQKQN